MLELNEETAQDYEAKPSSTSKKMVSIPEIELIRLQNWKHHLRAELAEIRNEGSPKYSHEEAEAKIKDLLGESA